jgi:hypothetical protein
MSSPSASIKNVRLYKISAISMVDIANLLNNMEFISIEGQKPFDQFWIIQVKIAFSDEEHAQFANFLTSIDARIIDLTFPQ